MDVDVGEGVEMSAAEDADGDSVKGADAGGCAGGDCAFWDTFEAQELDISTTVSRQTKTNQKTLFISDLPSIALESGPDNQKYRSLTGSSQ